MRETIAGATGIKIRNDQHLVVVGYADNVIIMAKSDVDLKRTTEQLIEEAQIQSTWDTTKTVESE